MIQWEQEIVHAQRKALTKLVAVLEGEEVQTPDTLVRNTIHSNPSSQLARLKAAHATYALNTSEMERISVGAYLNRQHIRN